MNFFKKFLILFPVLLGACSSPALSDQQLPQDGICVYLPAGLSGEGDQAYNVLDWSGTSFPTLLQIDENGGYNSGSPIEADIASGQPSVFVYDYTPSDQKFRYWLYKAAVPTGTKSFETLDAWPLEIPVAQHPAAEGIDPSADLLVSDLSFAFRQSAVLSTGLECRMKRMNAVLELKLSGIPEDHEMNGLVFISSNPLSGLRRYDILNHQFAEEDRLSGKLELHFEGKSRTDRTASGSRSAWMSVWPVVLNNWSVTVSTVAPDGKQHEFSGGAGAFSERTDLSAQTVTSLQVQLKDKADVPGFEPTPTRKEAVIEGGEGPTLELFRKMKAYAENGISTVDRWTTHLPPYEGVTIHEAKLIQYGKPTHVWVIEADPAKVGFELGTPENENTVPARHLQTVTGQARAAEKAGKKVIAAVNGDAWGVHNTHETYGIMIKDGVCLKNRAYFINSISNTDTFYATDTGEVGIADPECLKTVMAQKTVDTAIGGWYRLISQGGEPYAQPGAADGDPLLRDKNQSNESLRNFLNLNPRTFMGISDDRVYILVVDGRTPATWSQGLTLNGCARMLYSIGCKRGINMDGGGSSAIIKRSGEGFSLLNKPSDGQERAVANSLLVVAR